MPPFIACELSYSPLSIPPVTALTVALGTPLFTAVLTTRSFPKAFINPPRTAFAPTLSSIPITPPAANA